MGSLNASQLLAYTWTMPAYVKYVQDHQIRIQSRYINNDIDHKHHQMKYNGTYLNRFLYVFSTKHVTNDSPYV